MLVYYYLLSSMKKLIRKRPQIYTYVDWRHYSLRKGDPVRLWREVYYKTGIKKGEIVSQEIVILQVLLINIDN